MKAAEPEAGLSPGVASAVQHALFWLVFGNAIGVLIAILLLLPGLNPWLGEWTYGRLMMVHMNVALYGWCGLPMLAFLFTVYGVELGLYSAWARPVVWLWSAALAVGSASWLAGQTSGKLFLDWSGMPRVFFPLSMAALWVLLAASFAQRESPDARRRGGTSVKIAGLLVLAFVPFVIFFASGSGSYPAVNPDTGGPTGASQLESSLAIVLILLLVPHGVARRRVRTPLVWICWALLAAGFGFCFSLGRSDVSHRMPVQWLGLSIVLVWIPLVPAYYAGFEWNQETRRWRRALFWWWGLLVATGWVFFLPHVLDRLKFTDALVGHSLAAVAGFLSAMLVLVMLQCMGEAQAWILNRSWSFYLWNYGVLAYVLVMLIAGWLESGDPAFTIVPGAARQALYVIRLVTGLMMLAGSLEWYIASLSIKTSSARLPAKALGVTV